MAPEAARQYLAAYESTFVIKHYKGPTGIEHLDIRSVTRTKKRTEEPKALKSLFKKTAPEPDPEPEAVETTHEAFITLNGMERKSGSVLAKRQKSGEYRQKLVVPWPEYIDTLAAGFSDDLAKGRRERIGRRVAQVET